MNIEDIKQIMDDFDPGALLPDLSSLEGKVELICRIALLIGPVVLLTLGIVYFLLAPREANYRFGYRCFFGMGSSLAWRFTQRLAGAVWGLLGLILTIVMVVKTNGMREMAVMDQVWAAVHHLLWEAGLVLGSVVLINITVAVFFSVKGDQRFQIKKK